MPRVLVAPSGPSSQSLGDDAVWLCREKAGMNLDPWQELALREGLAESPGGGFVASETAVNCCRQNGKGEILIARILTGLFMLGEFILATAHETKTNNETWDRLLDIVRGCDDLAALTPKQNIRLANGEQGIKVNGGGRVRFIARSTSSGRGFPGVNCVIFDEAQILDDRHLAAVLPAQRATAKPQVWYFGTAPNPATREQAVVWAKLRRQALSGESKRLVYLEWSADDDADLDDPAEWAKANPALGTRISLETVEFERSRMAEADFKAECMGIGSWPGDTGFAVIPEERWAATEDAGAPRPSEPVVFAVDAMPDRSTATIAVAGARDDGAVGVEVVDRDSGVDWVVARLAQLCQDHACLGVVVDKAGPAATAIAGLEQEGLELIHPTVAELALAAQGFHDAAVAVPPRLRRPPDARLDAAVAAARRRPLRDAWYWARPDKVDASPLIACSLAWWAFDKLASVDAQPGAWVL